MTYFGINYFVPYKKINIRSCIILTRIFIRCAEDGRGNMHIFIGLDYDL